MSLAKDLEQGPRLFDGALGTQLLVSGFHPQRDLLGAGPDALTLTRPEQVRAVHESYLDAGAQWLRTNTFLATRSDLAHHKLGARAEELARRAVREARAAVDAWSDDVPSARVLGSIGPGHDPSTVAAAARAGDVCELAAWLLAAGVDGLMLETQVRLDHVSAAFRAVQPLAEAAGRHMVVSFALAPDGRLADGATLADVAAWARAERPLLLGINCGHGPETSEAHVRELRRHYNGRLCVLPTAGLPTEAGNLSSFPVGPSEFGETVAAWVRRYELAAVGGCCGTGPRHIAALCAALGRARPWADFGEPLADDEVSDSESEEGS